MDGMPRRRALVQSRKRRPVRHVKTFTGCSTCRSRHLKCDEGRPACQRCAASQLECGGYPGYRSIVQWKPVTSPSSFRNQAQVCDDELPRTRSRVRAISDLVDETGLATETAASSPTVQRTSATPAPIPTFSQDLGKTTEELVGLQSPIHPTAESHSPARSRASPRHLDVGAHLDAARSASPTYFTPPSVQSPTCTESHLDLLDNLHLQRRLIEHWIMHLSDAIMPIPGAVNPFKSIFVPLIDEGAHSPATQSSGTVALFYLVCSASAFHLAATTTTTTSQHDDFMNVALSHQSAGIRHLWQNLARNDPSQVEAILAALLVCLLYEPATARADFWLTHLRGAARWLQSIDIGQMTRSTTSAILYQNLIGTITFMRSQLLSEDLAHHESLCINSETLRGPYYLFQILGIPKRTLQLVSDVITTAARIRRGDESSEQQPEWLDRMEMELYLGMPQLCPPHGQGTMTPDLSYHYAWMFYFATIIYFKRAIRRVPLTEVQSLVEQSLDHIEQLAHCTTRPFSPFMWPVAMSFFEAQDEGLQKRAMVFVDWITERSTLSIWGKAKPLFLEFWQLKRGRVDGGGDMQWEEFLSDSSRTFIMLA